MSDQHNYPGDGANPYAGQGPEPHPAYTSQPVPQPSFYPSAPAPGDHGAGYVGPSAPPYGQTGQSGATGTPMTTPGKPPRKSRTALISSITGVVGLVLGLAIGSVGDGRDVEASVEASTTDEVDDDVGATTSGANDEAADEPEPTEDPEPAETPQRTEESEEESTPEPERGSRANPFLIGEEVGNEEWMVVLGEPREAWEEIQAENRFNDPPEEGFEHWIVPVTATYLGDETGNAAWDLTVEFVSSDGVTYDRCGQVIPNRLRDTGDLYEGGVAEGNVCLTVPAGADGLWTLTAGWFGEPAFFEVGE